MIMTARRIMMEACAFSFRCFKSDATTKYSEPPNDMSLYEDHPIWKYFLVLVG